MGQIIVGFIYVGLSIFFCGYVVTNIYTKKIKVSPYATFITGMFLISLIGIVLFEIRKFQYIDLLLNIFLCSGLIIFILRSYPSFKTCSSSLLEIAQKIMDSFNYYRVVFLYKTSHIQFYLSDRRRWGVCQCREQSCAKRK